MPDYPLIDLIATVGTWDFGGEAYIDTGFEGGLVIPIALRSDILSEPAMKAVEFANGAAEYAPHWPAIVELEGRQFRTEAIGVGSRFLLGRELIDQLEVCFEFGRNVRIRFRDQTE